MGQTIEVTTSRVGEVVLFDTDRSITGQDGSAFTRAAETDGSNELPAVMAQRLFAADPAVDHVFVASNQVVVKRRGGWTDEAVGELSAVIRDFFVVNG